MAPNPIIIPRQPRARQQRSEPDSIQARGRSTLIASSAVVVLVAAAFPRARDWVTSGCAIESLLLIYGHWNDSGLFRGVPVWVILACLNLSYTISSTSWLLHIVFITACYPAILLSCLLQFQTASYVARNWLRRLLRNFHFFRDKIGFFDLPALEIDTEVSGLFVVRGIEVSVSTLTIVAHGLELGVKMGSDVELAINADLVTIKLFRRIDISDVYGNIKCGKDMTFGKLEEVNMKDGALFQYDSAMLRAATGISPSTQDPRSSDGPTEDSSIRDAVERTKTLKVDDAGAERQYDEVLERIEKSSNIGRARKAIEESNVINTSGNEKDMREAICAKLQDMPSVPHPPGHLVRVSFLQNCFPRVRRFLHRLPFLERALLNSISYLHPISISSINVAGSGERLRELLHEHVFKKYASQDAAMKQLENEMSSWLDTATFCLEVSDVGALGQVPLSITGQNITGYIRSADVTIYRTELESGNIQQIARLGGADLTMVLPSFLLPHHEHSLPPDPTADHGQGEFASDGKGQPSDAQSNDGPHEPEPDETEMIISVHTSLPSFFAQDLVDFGASLIKATDLIGVDTLLEQEGEAEGSSEEQGEPESEGKSGLRTLASGIKQRLKPGSAGPDNSQLATDSRQVLKDGVRKGLNTNAVGDKVNDRWVAKTVGKLAARLEQALGDIGYTTTMPLPLGPYRKEVPSKILP